MSGEGPKPDQAATTGSYTTRLAADVRRRLLTLQYERKMAGEVWSFSDIIRELLDRAGAA